MLLWAPVPHACASSVCAPRCRRNPRLAFGSVHGAAALELVYWLRRAGYSKPVYFDTFPANEDPVREAELNIRRFKELWRRAGDLEDAGLEELLARHDALAALELVESLRGGGSGGGGAGGQCGVPDAEEE
jgi:hypothetical protein